MSELSVYELEAQHGELLPERETLGVIGSNVVNSGNAFGGAILSNNNITVNSNDLGGAILPSTINSGNGFGGAILANNNIQF